LSWNFRIAAGVGNNPLADAFKSNGDDLWARGVTINPFGEIDNAEIHRSYGEIYPTDGLGYQWFWNEADQVVVLPHAARAQYAIGQALLTARGAEMVTPILEAHPELSTRVRTYVNSPATTAMLLSLYSPDWVAPFLDILGLASVEDVPEISLDDLEGDPGFLFSYESLRMLTTFYSRDSGVTDGLIAKLDAAEAAESMGHTQAKAGQLKAFQNQVRAQTGKALSEPQSRTMLALSKTL
jgi:hypothetical protein